MDGYMLLYIAAQSGQPEMMTYLTTAGVEVNAAAKYGSTPLYVAAQNGRFEWLSVSRQLAQM